MQKPERFLKKQQAIVGISFALLGAILIPSTGVAASAEASSQKSTPPDATKATTPAKAVKPTKPTKPTLENGWEDASSLLFNGARDVFTKADAQPGNEERERSLGLAVTLLNVQPRLQSNLDRARERFEALANGTPKDDLAVAAKYFLARMDAFYEMPPRLENARKLYHELIAEHAGNLYAEYGITQLVLMDLYDDIPTEERARRFSALEELAPRLTTQAGRRGYHINMGNAYLTFGKEGEDFHARAIRHLVAAEAEGITRWQVEAASWIAIGELAQAQGQTDLAKTYYGKFLEKYKRDNRHYTIEQRLKALEAPAVPAAPEDPNSPNAPETPGNAENATATATPEAGTPESSL